MKVMKAIGIRINNRINPLGIDDPAPHISWICDSGVKQAAYHVIVSDDDGKVLFDTGEVFSDRMRCAYGGSPLSGRTRAHISITLKDEQGKEEVSQEDAWFETGLMNPNDWSAKFISGVDTDKAERLPCDYFRKKFVLRSGRKIKKARLYATARGVYLAYINGRRLSGVLAPGFTDYNKRLYYQTYDVTSLILPDTENELSFIVGDGWYKGGIGRDKREYVYGIRTALLAQLELTYDDGQTDVIATGEAFDWCANGPLRYSDISSGEIYDARMIPTYFTKAEEEEPDIQPDAALCDMPCGHERLNGTVTDSYAGRWVIDFGRLITGYVSLKYTGTFGEEVKIYLSEETPDDTEKKPDVTYICSGTDEGYEPHFFVKLFRYAVVEGVRELKASDVTATEVYAATRFVGDFSCEDESIEALVKEAKELVKLGFLDVPITDPVVRGATRTCDAMLFAKASMYIADLASLYDKWLWDVRDAQDDKGSIPLNVPDIDSEEDKNILNGRIGWADAAIRIPYLLWRTYGDTRYIEDHLPLIQEWKNFIREEGGHKEIYELSAKDPMKERIAPFLLPSAPYNHYIVESGMQWGEWEDPEGQQALEKDALPRRARQEVNAAYTAYSMRLAAQMMEAVGEDDDADECWEISLGARGGYRHHFISDERHHREETRQAPLVRTLAFGLAGLGAEEHIIARDLDRMVEESGFDISTGYLSTPDILSVLCRFGYEDTAYRVLKNGAFTDKVSGAVSHVVRASMSTFCFDTILGISVDSTGSFNIAPIPGKGISEAKGYWESPFGKVSVEWNERTDGNDGYEFDITVPPNTSASIELPDGQLYFVGSGNYRYLTDKVKFFVE